MPQIPACLVDADPALPLLPPRPARSRTEEGYAIYSEAELGLCKAGGTTDKCPFDCDCCF